jgi:hypothetical protein
MLSRLLLMPWILSVAVNGARAEGPLRAFYDDAPQCIVVLAGPVAAGIVAGERIAAALARRLSALVARVIHPAERRRLERALAVDLAHPADARHFAAATQCPAFLRWRIVGAGRDNVLVWSQKHIRLCAEIIRASDGALLWRAQAKASRNSGDVPLSVLSLPLAVLRAAAFQTDEDAVASMLDDLARRLLASLPDLR